MAISAGRPIRKLGAGNAITTRFGILDSAGADGTTASAMHMAMQQLVMDLSWVPDFPLVLDGAELQWPASIICIWWSGTGALASAARAKVGANITDTAISIAKNFRIFT